MSATGGHRALQFDLSGIPVRVRAAPGRLLDGLAEDWAEYGGAAAGTPFLDAELREEPQAGLPPRSLVSMTADFDGPSALYRMAEGELHVDASGGCMIHVPPGPERERHYALINLLLPALAWSLPTRGALLVHAAGIVLDRSAHLLVGASGAGKTTWAGIARQAGADCLSDDLVFVSTDPDGASALNMPFRSRHRRSRGPARWPLASLLFPSHGAEARLDPLDRVTALGRLVGNLPYVTGALPDEPRITSCLDRLLESVRPATLTFPKDDSFVELLRSIGSDVA